jgi:hypothetical protein
MFLVIRVKPISLVSYAIFSKNVQLLLEGVEKAAAGFIQG